MQNLSQLKAELWEFIKNRINIDEFLEDYGMSKREWSKLSDIEKFDIVNDDNLCYSFDGLTNFYLGTYDGYREALTKIVEHFDNINLACESQGGDEGCYYNNFTSDKLETMFRSLLK